VRAPGAHQSGIHSVESTRWTVSGIVTTARHWSAAAGTGRGRRGARPQCRSGSAASGAGATARQRVGAARRPGVAAAARRCFSDHVRSQTMRAARVTVPR
jgi:hypothetical protein